MENVIAAQDAHFIVDQEVVTANSAFLLAKNVFVFLYDRKVLRPEAFINRLVLFLLLLSFV